MAIPHETEESQDFLEQTSEINNIFGELKHKMVALGYLETSMFIQVAHKSFENEVFNIIKKWQ